MRFASLPLAAVVLAGCGVPAVTFVDADASNDAGATTGSDAGPDGDVAADAGADARQTEAGSDGSEGGAGDYCVGPDGGVPPPGLACCPGGQGEACAGACMLKACRACEPCTWPNVCCTTGANGVCKPSC
jgi:hypothetical protein